MKNHALTEAIPHGRERPTLRLDTCFFRGMNLSVFNSAEVTYQFILILPRIRQEGELATGLMHSSGRVAAGWPAVATRRPDRPVRRRPLRPAAAGSGGRSVRNRAAIVVTQRPTRSIQALDRPRNGSSCLAPKKRLTPGMAGAKLH